MKIKYVGGAHVREIGKADFKRNDLDQDRLVWDRENSFIAEVSDKVAEFLLNDPEFKEVTNEDKPPKKMGLDADQEADKDVLRSGMESESIPPIPGAGSTP